MTSPPPPQDRTAFKVAIICALPLEAECVQVLFDNIWDKQYGKTAGDTNAYTTGIIEGHNIVLAYMPNYGKVSASAVAANLSFSYTGIKLVLLVGICGAVPFKPGTEEEIIMGDVIISTAIVQYDFGRRYPHGFEKKGNVEDVLGRADPSVRAFLSMLGTHHYRRQVQGNLARLLPEVQNELSGSRYPGAAEDKLYKATYHHQHHGDLECNRCKDQEDTCPRSCNDLGCGEDDLILRKRLDTTKASHLPLVHFGRIGSADTVMKSAEARDAAAGKDGLIGFEMEGAGVWEKYPVIVIKAACDYADSHKNKKWQGYAAAAAAACMKSVLKVWIPEDDFSRQG